MGLLSKGAAFYVQNLNNVLDFRNTQQLCRYTGVGFFSWGGGGGMHCKDSTSACTVRTSVEDVRKAPRDNLKPCI